MHIKKLPYLPLSTSTDFQESNSIVISEEKKHTNKKDTTIPQQLHVLTCTCGACDARTGAGKSFHKCRTMGYKLKVTKQVDPKKQVSEWCNSDTKQSHHIFNSTSAKEKSSHHSDDLQPPYTFAFQGLSLPPPRDRKCKLRSS